MAASRLPVLVGILLSRIVVPAWIVTGAAFKMMHRTPKNLPKTLFGPADSLGIDLYIFLWVIIGLEFFAVGVMLLVPRWARAMAVFMLGCFCLILVAEMAGGNLESCGCLGKVTLPPWVMLLIDGALLAGIMLSKKPRNLPNAPIKWPVAALGLWTIAGFALSGAIILAERAPAPENGNGEVLPAAVTLPGYYLPDCETWVGKPWREVDLAAFMTEGPADLDQGKRYLIFFQRSCDHCQELLDLHFADPAPVPTTLVAIPETKQGFTPESNLDIYCNGCTEIELPVGCDWIITTPIVVALEDGVVRCAQEGDEPEEPACLIWH